MPELPEVETTRRGLAPYLENQTIDAVEVREARLRWPVPVDLAASLRGQRIVSLQRRGKYLLGRCEHGSLIVHLGMSGSLRRLPADTPWQKHDHIQFRLADDFVLRFHDPRRFGAVLWTAADPEQHPLLAHLGPEPLDPTRFNGEYLHAHAVGRTLAVKNYIMDAQVVVGVGNIYANEALFLAGIHPARSAGQIDAARYARLATEIQRVLAAAIAQGGTTLRDFVDGHGRPGYFQQTLRVYQRSGLPCPVCAESIQTQRIGQRSSFFCPNCQT